MAMTIGGWSLNAFATRVAIRNWQWATSCGALCHLWAFAALELVVLLWFRGTFRIDRLLSWPYLAMLALGLVAAARAAVDVTPGASVQRAVAP